MDLVISSWGLRGSELAASLAQRQGPGRTGNLAAGGE